MALQVWLPLNGDLHNQGLKQVKIINNGTTFSTNGKIGQCCNIASGQYLGFDAANQNNHKYPYISIACWVYPTQSDSTERHIICCYQSGGCGINLKDTKLGGQIYIGGYKSCYTPTTIALNTWHHICMTYNGSKLCLYLNGELVSSLAASGPITYHNTCPWQIAGNPGATAFGSNNFIGKINDVRIYDHALSDKEVEEISKGLILHYKLDNSLQRNLLSANATKTATISSGNTSVYSGQWYYDTKFQPYLIEGTIITLEYDYSVSGITATSSYIYPQLNNTRLGPAQSLTYAQMTANPTGHHIETYRVSAEQAAYANAFRTRLKLNASNEGASFTISNLQIYFGPPKGNIIYDCSGYNNNGTITGSLTTSTPSPRYSYATKYPDSECAINIGNLSTMIPEGIFTFNIWFKKVTGEWSSKNWETILGGPSGFELEGKLSNTTNAYIHPYSWGGGSTSSPNSYSIAYTLDEWHMVTMVRTTSNSKFYLDGELKVTGSTGSIPSGNYFIGAWQTAIKQNYRGYFSDVRIYTTALIETQIKELYNTSMIIENDTIKPRNLE